jgi:hypothetical protein
MAFSILESESHQFLNRVPHHGPDNQDLRTVSGRLAEA